MFVVSCSQSKSNKEVANAMASTEILFQGASKDNLKSLRKINVSQAPADFQVAWMEMMSSFSDLNESHSDENLFKKWAQKWYQLQIVAGQYVPEIKKKLEIRHQLVPRKM